MSSRKRPFKFTTVTCDDIILRARNQYSTKPSPSSPLKRPTLVSNPKSDIVTMVKVVKPPSTVVIMATCLCDNKTTTLDDYCLFCFDCDTLLCTEKCKYRQHCNRCKNDYCSSCFGDDNSNQQKSKLCENCQPVSSDDEEEEEKKITT